MRTLLLAFICLISLSSLAQSQWKQRADFGNFGRHRAVAVAVGTLATSGDDMTLFICDDVKALPKDAKVRAESGPHVLASLEGFQGADDLGTDCGIVGVLPAPLSSQKT